MTREHYEALPGWLSVRRAADLCSVDRKDLVDTAMEAGVPWYVPPLKPRPGCRRRFKKVSKRIVAYFHGLEPWPARQG